MQTLYRIGKIPGYRRLKRMLSSLRRFQKSEVAQERLKILKFYEKYGGKATKEAFGVSRGVIYHWRKKLNGQEGRLEGLIPVSTKPKRTRRSRIPVEIIGYIRKLREEHPRIGKEKIKIILDGYCKEKGLPIISESTIGNIIKRHNFFAHPSGRIYHDPSSGWAKKNNKKKRRLRVKYPPKVQDYGYILSDTVEKVIEGIKFYFLSAIDIKSKFALTLLYPRLSSAQMKDFYLRFRQVYPLEIKKWQNDNGKENLRDFEEILAKEGIPHLFSYPHSPRINAFIERYNRTLQEEFINYNEGAVLENQKEFQEKLANYLIFYNSKRPHKSLGLKSPIDYLIQERQMSKMSLTYTEICFFLKFSYNYILSNEKNIKD